MTASTDREGLEELADRALERLRDHPPTEAEIVSGGVDFIMGPSTEGRTCAAEIIERCGPTDWERYRCGARVVEDDCRGCGQKRYPHMDHAHFPQLLTSPFSSAPLEYGCPFGDCGSYDGYVCEKGHPA